MALSIPYTYIQCPCADQSVVDPSDPNRGTNEEEDEGERTFDPGAPRSAYSLFPLSYLLFCEDCQQIRCPRCVAEEVVAYFCPNCLFEVPSSNLRAEGNRCTRNCYQCPVCIGPLQVGSVQPATDPKLLAPEKEPSANGGPYTLFCQYCNWTSAKIGIEFERRSGIHSQLVRLKNCGEAKLTPRELRERRRENPEAPPWPDAQLDRDQQFASLKNFYQDQLAATKASSSLSGLPLQETLGFSSPAALSRIMSLYTGRGYPNRGQKSPSDIMCEASNTEEGLKLAQLDESAAIKKLMAEGWDAMTSHEQKDAQVELVYFQSDLRPIPYLLRTKRSKRCSVCRHIISKPESKVSSTRFRIRLHAKSYIPTITIHPMAPTAAAVAIADRPAIVEEPPLTPLKPYQFILTFKNPLFESIKVTLATPNTTPGRFASRVTILCPQFEVDANTDKWDDALRDDGRTEIRRAEDALGGAEAGKIWEKGRNWVRIVLEVIPADLRTERTSHLDKEGKAAGDTLAEDEDILEIPMLVRVEWEADARHELGSTAADKEKEGKEKRELAYWCVLGVGRIQHE